MKEWKEITTLEEWKQAYEATDQRPLVILKYSTICSVSTNAMREFEAYLKANPRNDIDYRTVKVIESRPISNDIAEVTGVKHESPQILFIDKMHVVWNTSHWSVTKEHISAVLD